MLIESVRLYLSGSKLDSFRAPSGRDRSQSYIHTSTLTVSTERHEQGKPKKKAQQEDRP